nr:translesion error-prone DNA polymerase V autoproteolytic subunit [Acidithiobacillus montserratensis]
MVEDGADDGIDLHTYCVPHPENSFLLRVSGSSMQGAGIQDGDLLVVDRSIRATDGRIVIAALDGEVTVKRLRRKGQRVMLVPENPEYPTIAVRPDQSFTVWGVVIFVVHRV